MKRLTLTRRWYEPDRTIGELHCENEFVAFTMEPGSEDREAPRVPLGFYHLVYHDGPSFRFKDTWALAGRDVSPEYVDGKRYAVLFHAGNKDEETLGCIMLGMSIGRFGGETAMVASRAAMDRLRGFLGENDGYLTIKGG